MSYILGADPEFLLLNSRDNCVAAEEVLIDDNRSNIVGIDGAGAAVELRPTPTDSPMELLRTIRGALIAGYERLEGCADRWLAGTGYIGEHPTGGHIHIGGLGIETSRQTRQLTWVLDTFIGVPLLALEPPVGRAWRRDIGSYGFWGDIRRQEWGIEYRTPSSWLVSPATARIAIGLAWLVGTSWRDLEVPSWARDIRDTRVTNKDSYTDWLRTKAKDAMRRLAHLPRYKEVKAFLAPYNFLAHVVGDWQEDRNMLDTWRLVNKAPLMKASLPVQEMKAEEHNTEDHHDSLIWNLNDANINSVKTHCGAVQTDGEPGRLWIVGAKQKRGASILLSPALAALAQPKQLLAKRKMSWRTWPNYPPANGELVIGLPAGLRRDDPYKAGVLVRLIAMSAFNRLSK